MKIVESVRKGEVVNSLDVNYAVCTISSLKRNICEELIRYGDGEWFFDKPISGKVYITYPLSVIVEIEVKEVETVGGLLWLIAKAYREIYKEEEDAYKKQVKRPTNSLNREKSNGKYGIWGHFLEELIFEGVEIHDNGTIHISIGS